MIYLDNASTTQIVPEVLDEMLPFLKEEYGNPGTIYTIGQNAKAAIDKARERVAAFIHADDQEQIIFTSGGTEANNIALMVNPNKRWFKISNIEHDSIQNVEYCNEFFSGFIKVDENGKVSLKKLQESISNTTPIRFISIMYVNNEIGSVNPIETIGEFCSKNNIIFHSDCVQAAGCHPINVNELHLDFASLSSHKIHGPKGVGALYIRDRALACNLSRTGRFGGENQEFGIRPGTENVAGIVGFGKACEILTGNEFSIGAYITSLKRTFWSLLQYYADAYGLLDILHCNAESNDVYGKVLSIRFDGIDAETMILMLNAKGVCVSAGSACRSHEQEPSRVLKAIGLTDDQARDTIRVSFSLNNTEEEVQSAAKIVAETASALKKYVT